jgi:hypothetical protein
MVKIFIERLLDDLKRHSNELRGDEGATDMPADARVARRKRGARVRVHERHGIMRGF